MSEASKLIRDSLAALPISDQLPWHDGGKKGIVDSDGLTIMTGLQDYVIAPHRALVVLLASPDVASAVADLLDILDRISLMTVVDERDNEISLEILDARMALEAAIRRAGA